MAGLVPAMHVFDPLQKVSRTWMPGDTSGFTRVFDALWPGMTDSSNARISIGLRQKRSAPATAGALRTVA
jgi:hypothetical protein